MSEAFERAARAIYMTHWRLPSEAMPGLAAPTPPVWEDASPKVQAWVRAQAKSLLEAIREPDDAMLRAARDWSAAKYGAPVGNEGATGCWQAMVDEVLRDV